jgi:hemolysin activation/secretion protein
VIANDEPPDVGSIHGQLTGVVRNLIGYGDALSLSYGRTAGANIGSVGWELPVTRYDTTLSLRWSYDGAGVVSDAFSGLNISSVVQTAEVGMSQPLYRTLSQVLTVSIRFDYTTNNEFLLGEPFSFSPGYINGHAQASAVSITLDWVDRTASSVAGIAIRR